MKAKRRIQALVLALALLVTGVFAGTGKEKEKEPEIIDDKYRTYYEVFLYSFSDSNGDGIGDIRGLIDKLDYINDGDGTTDTDLGCNGIWLMPVMPSTTYHKYDVTDYEDIDAEYGDLDDFKELVTECHKRGIRLIIDLVMNHTSSKHPWFEAACDYIEGLGGAEPSEAECPYFGYYNFTREPKGDVYYEVGDTGWYYEAQFWSEMPDLNLENQAVRDEFDGITSFWMDLGVDGFRLDAAGEYETGQTTKNIEILSWFHSMVEEKNADAYIVAEVWQDLDTYAKYYESGIDSCFDFAFANADGIIADSLKKTAGYNASSYGNAAANVQKKLAAYNADYIDAPFYTNHDMARSAGYYSGDYSENMTKISGAMNLFMSGNAFLYYGEELGMKGSGKDENKRAPMYWSDAGNEKTAEGMCHGPEGMDAIKMKYGSLEEQKDDPDSVYNFYRAVIKLRNAYPEIARGQVAFLKDLSDENVCVLKKTWNDRELVIAFNLSEQAETVDLSDVTLNGREGTKMSLGGALATTDEEIGFSGGTLSLPAYSVAILE